MTLKTHKFKQYYRFLDIEVLLPSFNHRCYRTVFHEAESIILRSLFFVPTCLIQTELLGASLATCFTLA